MRCKLILFIMSFALSTLSFAESAGKNAKESSSTEIATVILSGKTKLKPHVVSVEDPNVQPLVPAAHPVKTEYDAYDGRDVLDKLFGGRGKWSKFKDIKFTCVDGYQPILPVEDFKEGGFHFAFKKHDDSEFAILNQLKGGKKESLAPYYVIWDASPKHKNLGHYWPYQVKSIALE